MATFIAEVQGTRGPASRLGHKSIKVIVNSWDKGFVIRGWKSEDGSINWNIEETGGSNGVSEQKLIATYRDNKRT